MEIKSIQDKTKNAFAAYMAKASLLTNYQLCRAYFEDRGASVMRVAEMILCSKYKRPWQKKAIRQAMSQLTTERAANKRIRIPKLKIECTANDVFTDFIQEHFTAMIIACRANSNYPLIIKEIAYKFT